MATFQADDINNRHRHVGPFGDVTSGWGTVSPTSSTDGDLFQPVRIPGGVEVTSLVMKNGAMDAVADLDASIGYAPVGSTPAANITYFGADSTVLQAAAITRYEDFVPLRLEEDIFVQVEVTTTSATHATVALQMTYTAINHGVK